MASNLNTPADFLTRKGAEMLKANFEDKVDLLPPSAFGSAAGNDGWKELAEATKEVLQLKLENQRLKETPSIPIIMPAPVQDIRVTEEHKHLPDVDRRYIDELLMKQASEIGDLKKELQQVKVTHREEVTKLERDYAITEKKYIQEVASLETEVKSQEDRYISQVSRLSQEHDEEKEELNHEVVKLKDELNSLVKRSATRVSNLESQLKASEENLSVTKVTLDKELRSRDYTVDNLQKQIAQLKTYIGDSERTHKPVEVWRKENDTLRNKIQICEADRDNLQSNLQLLNIRLSSLNEILSVQETELSRTTKEKFDKDQRENLLTRWREKVFALLVQQKTSEMMQKKNDYNWKEKLSDLQDQMMSVSSQKDVLAHSLSDVKAQLDIESNNNKRLQQEADETQKVAVMLDQQLSQDRESVDRLVNFSRSITSAMDTKLQPLTAALVTLQRYGQRINFASGRVEMLQGLYARRDALLQRKTEEVEKQTGDRKGEITTTDSANHLQEELDRVIRERDALAVQLRQDSETWDERLQTATATYQEEITSLRKTVEDLEYITQEKSQRTTDLSERCEVQQRELEEMSERIEALNTTLAQQEIRSTQALSEQKTLLQTETAEELSEVNRKLDDARREHTKAVVALRQLERQSNREKERSAEHLVTVETHYTKHIAQLQQQLQALEKDRNLMMATLRQEGLIGKVKATRSEPITNEVEVPMRKAVISPPTLEEATDKETTDEPLESVLEDLKALTSAVLKENASDSDTDD
ncbi:coiled-coil alpha-helical rod protein 1-like [Pecten maximus]|uniref:coiled-coil alpha-helical rod protein 1-like n=1 Tax=Pecten maximus TaxID=6579 RepID=UPI0014591205|nr:coiled-coil alpha-helical rod protein 1-like [Pecten maximus]